MQKTPALKDIMERIPQFKPEWMPMLNRLREHPHAPRWNTQCGDRIEESDLSFIESFRKRLYEKRSGSRFYPPDFIIQWIESIRGDVRLFQSNIGVTDIKNDFSKIKPMTREDLVLRLAEVVPWNISLDRLIVNDTSGTTGHPIKVPNHPKAIGCYDPMVLFMLERHGLKMNPNHDMVACFLICAQDQTITYCTVHSGLNGAGYAKINLKPSDWPRPESPSEYISDLNPWFLTGDPLSFHELMKLNLSYKPNALLSTAMMLTPALREIIQKHFSCPVIDLYSLNDTGPIAYSCPIHKEAYHILPTDIHVEIIDESGNTLNEGDYGEIAVTGGRNPFVPLLRYRTGDRGRLNFDACECGDPMPRLTGLNGRAPVYFKNDQGAMVNPADLSKIFRRFPVAQFQFHQYSDLSCRLTLRGVNGFLDTFHHEIMPPVKKLFGSGIEIIMEENPDLGSEKKIIPFISNFSL